MRSFARFVSNYLFPTRCAGCGILGENLCMECVHKIQSPHQTHCPRCGQGSTFPLQCPCDYRNIPIISLFSLNHTLRTVLHRIKYKNNPKILREILMNLGIQQIKTLAFLAQHKNALVVPIPLHRSKFLERGYNVPALIAQTLAQTLSLEAAHILERTIETKTQAKISNIHQREKNTAGAFRFISGNKIPEHVILIDDVITSGATMSAATKSLKNTGCKLIWGLSLAQEEWQVG